MNLDRGIGHRSQGSQWRNRKERRGEEREKVRSRREGRRGRAERRGRGRGHVMEKIR